MKNFSLNISVTSIYFFLYSGKFYAKHCTGGNQPKQNQRRNRITHFSLRNNNTDLYSKKQETIEFCIHIEKFLLLTKYL